MDDVSDWRVGDQIAIASTGLRHSQEQNEQRTITKVDGTTLTLDKALDHQHVSISQELGGRTVETRGEVGLLTRNVKVVGSQNKDFVTTIPACPRKFDSGQFATQSCFNGKFGEEQVRRFQIQLCIFLTHTHEKRAFCSPVAASYVLSGRKQSTNG